MTDRTEDCFLGNALARTVGRTAFDEILSTVSDWGLTSTKPSFVLIGSAQPRA